MPIPDLQSLLLPVLKLGGHDEVQVREAISRLADVFELTSDERARLNASNTSVFGNRVHWAKTFLKAAGLVDQPRRGWYRVTPRGHEVLRSQPHRIDNAYLNRFDEFREFRGLARTSGEERGLANDPSSDEQVDLPSVDPEEAIAKAAAAIGGVLKAEVIARVRGLSPSAFEKLIIELLLAMKYGGSRPDAARALGRTGDDGVDGVVDEDALGLGRIFVQAKRYQLGNNVGSAAIREFYGSLNMKKASKGLFVTTSSYTRDARETAEQLGTRIVLIDGEQLAGLMIRFGVGCRTVDRIEIKRLDEDFFEDLDT